MRILTILLCSLVLCACSDDTSPPTLAADASPDLLTSPDLTEDAQADSPADDMTAPPDMPAPSQPVFIDLTPRPNARGLSRADLMSLQAWDPATGVLTFSDSLPMTATLAPGDILAAEVSPLTPYGLLRAVEAVERRDGLVIVRTRQAFLPEAFSGSFYIEINTALLPARPVGVDTGEVRVDVNRLNESFKFAISETLVDQDGVPNTGDEVVASLEAGGSLLLGLGGDVGIDYDFPIDVDVYAEIKAGAGFDQYVRGKLEAGISGPIDETRKLQDHEFTPVTIWVGPVPIVIIPAIRPSFRLHGTSTPSTLQLDQSTNFFAGIRYRSGDGWFAGVEGPTFSPPTFSMILPDQAQGQLTGELILRGEAMIYGLVGPYADARIGLQNTIQKPSPKHWDIAAVLGVGVGMQIDLGVFGEFGYGPKDIFNETIPLQSAPQSTVPPRIDALTAQQIVLGADGSPAPALIVGAPVRFLPKTYDEIGTGLTLRAEIDGQLVAEQDRYLPIDHTFTTPGAHAVRLVLSSSISGLSAERTFSFTAQHAPPTLLVFDPAPGTPVYADTDFTIILGATGYGAGAATVPLSCDTLFAQASAQDSFTKLSTPSWGLPDRCYVRARLSGVGSRAITLRATDPISGQQAQRVLNVEVLAKPLHVPPILNRAKPQSSAGYVHLDDMIPDMAGLYPFRVSAEDPDSPALTFERWSAQAYCNVTLTPRSGAPVGQPWVVQPLNPRPLPAEFERAVSLPLTPACGATSRRGWEVRYEARGQDDAQSSAVSWWVVAATPIN